MTYLTNHTKLETLYGLAAITGSDRRRRFPFRLAKADSLPPPFLAGVICLMRRAASNTSKMPS